MSRLLRYSEGSDPVLPDLTRRNHKPCEWESLNPVVHISGWWSSCSTTSPVDSREVTGQDRLGDEVGRIGFTVYPLISSVEPSSRFRLGSTESGTGKFNRVNSDLRYSYYVNNNQVRWFKTPLFNTSSSFNLVQGR